LIASKPVSELNNLSASPVNFKDVAVTDFDLTSKTGKLKGPARIKLTSGEIKNFTVTLSNSKGQKLVIGFDKSSNQYFIDRTASGKTDFEKGFGKRHTAPRFVQSKNFDLTLVIDDASVELFADNGLTVMTEIFFPDENYADIGIQSKEKLIVTALEFSRLKSIFEN
jgi:fructan beta-fructosidase